MVRNHRCPKATRTRRRAAILLPLLVAAVGASPRGQEPAARESVAPAGNAPAGGARTISPGNWPRLHLPDPVGYRVARKALDLAWERLARIDCGDVLKAFNDRAGHALDERLRELGLDRQTYLTRLFFIDGSRETPCINGSFAFTTPGSRVVGICVEELKRTWQASPEHAVSRLIHEMLHTLGLGEDPPSSDEITRRVRAGCGR